MNAEAVAEDQIPEEDEELQGHMQQNWEPDS